MAHTLKFPRGAHTLTVTATPQHCTALLYDAIGRYVAGAACRTTHLLCEQHDHPDQYLLQVGSAAFTLTAAEAKSVLQAVADALAPQAVAP